MLDSNETNNQIEELLTVDEVAKMFHVKPHTVRNWLRRKQLPKEIIFKIGATVRIKKTELQKFILRPAL